MAVQSPGEFDHDYEHGERGDCIDLGVGGKQAIRAARRR